jgi:hypothetical protein
MCERGLAEALYFAGVHGFYDDSDGLHVWQGSQMRELDLEVDEVQPAAIVHIPCRDHLVVQALGASEQ